MADPPAPQSGSASANGTRAPRPWRAGAALAAVLLAAGALATWWSTRREDAPAPASFPLPPLSPSPFLNTKSGVAFVGSDACRSCHPSEHYSYGRTGMGRSMAEADPNREPPDAEFDHALSKRRYQVRRKDGRLWHRELLLTTGPADEVVLSEFPLKYVVGSGRHSLTYLVEADGFLVESPVTWYASKQAWGMSPGYDRPNHSSFERATGESCLICHAGQAEAQHGSLHKMHIHEAAIGCERCHGPGALHVERRRAPRAEAEDGPIDTTIVNPAHLSRELGEAICQQCHLRTSATVVARGRKPGDFRPGLPLQDFRHDYRLDVADAAMTVVGHVEQMHLSRCYQASGTLTCTTCHDPHHEPRPKARERHYRSLCLSCHQPERCKVDPVRRHKESPQNHCVQCHMPRSPTEIPHLAFTHHRIGIHDQPPVAATPAMPTNPDEDHSGFGVLKPFLDLSRLKGIDEKRSLGLGYLEAANRHQNEQVAMRYRELSLALLTEARDAGLRDGPLDAALARLRFDMELDDGVLELAQSALTLGGLDGQDHCNALFLVADQLTRRGRRAEAIPFLEKLGGLRRHSTQWLLRADCERASGSPAAIDALETAVRINPRLWKVHQSLAVYYREMGDGKRADWHERRALP